MGLGLRIGCGGEAQGLQGSSRRIHMQVAEGGATEDGENGGENAFHPGFYDERVTTNKEPFSAARRRRRRRCPPPSPPPPSTAAATAESFAGESPPLVCDLITDKIESLDVGCSLIEPVSGSEYSPSHIWVRGCVRNCNARGGGGGGGVYAAGNCAANEKRGPACAPRGSVARAMGADWSKLCQAAVGRSPADRIAATNSSYYSLAAAFAVVSALSFCLLLHHLRARDNLWRDYVWFLSLTCAGSVFGKRSASVARSLSCLSAAAGLTAWASNARSVNSYFDSDAAIYKDTDSAALRAQQQRLLLQYDVFAAVYQFTQVSQPLTTRLNLPAAPPSSRSPVAHRDPCARCSRSASSASTYRSSLFSAACCNSSCAPIPPASAQSAAASASSPLLLFLSTW
jgi:hypothetical protein